MIDAQKAQDGNTADTMASSRRWAVMIQFVHKCIADGISRGSRTAPSRGSDRLGVGGPWRKSPSLCFMFSLHKPNQSRLIREAIYNFVDGRSRIEMAQRVIKNVISLVKLNTEACPTS